MDAVPDLHASGRITVVLADMPALVGEMLRRALCGADVNVVELQDPHLPLDAEAMGDVLIAPSESVGLRAAYQHLLRERPAMRMLALATNGGAADLYELRLVGSDVGVEGVAAAVRNAVLRIH